MDEIFTNLLWCAVSASSIPGSAGRNVAVRREGVRSEELVRALKRARVLVVGDVMLDRYWFGEVDRISPEAPVSVVKFGPGEERPGGAANVARNAAALGAGG